ncbi:putative PAS/PAC sensor protein [Denitrovibrio acetiphilus DSM 12809]|uniref:Putative PAS/PAC sensor protein n=1 Tax=Denitrovibrio acetiphilus (strain DSM 12809 / NBRC 114555 / N2460) TaxID=522772 RepID=D4H5J1_DENA2|nr:PAS domain S-box protein [Denitrovibrio acetiphilus]ADD67611.1 putative PAS/PAC sensor protein [Denitrovibrio acetiphilus DSM 12809]
MKPILYKKLLSHPELDKLLEKCFSFTKNINDADVIITDSSDVLKEARLNIIITSTIPENNVSISPDLPPESMLEAIKLSIKTYSISPRIDKISMLQEQNALLSEANKGLVELYNLIDNKNNQIEFLKNKLENIINSAGESIVEIDLNNVITYANKKFEDTTGFSHEKWNHMNFLELVHPEHREEYLKTIKIVSKEKTSNLEMQLKISNGAYITVNAYMTVVSNGETHFEIIFEDISKKLLIEQHMKKLEEKAIVAGFSRHLSHNILNALTVAAGFLRKIKQEACINDAMGHKWNIVEQKCKLIEEIVTGYNDYTNAISMQSEERFDIVRFTHSLSKEIADKTFSKNFSAFLYNFLDQYNLTVTPKFKGSFEVEGSEMFLKMALCYIIKDSIRYFDEYVPIDFNFITEKNGSHFTVIVEVQGVEVPAAILDTMLQPWNHQVLSQSFDYWGIVIANVIIEKHGGTMTLRKEKHGLSYSIQF